MDPIGVALAENDVGHLRLLRIEVELVHAASHRAVRGDKRHVAFGKRVAIGLSKTVAPATRLDVYKRQFCGSIGTPPNGFRR